MSLFPVTIFFMSVFGSFAILKAQEISPVSDHPFNCPDPKGSKTIW